MVVVKDACQPIHAASAEDLATGHFNACPEEEREVDEEVNEDMVGDEEEAQMLETVEVDQVRFSLLLWLS